MNRNPIAISSFLVAALALPAALSAQKIPAGVELQLAATSEVVFATGEAVLQMSIDVKEDTKVPAVLLSGALIKTTVNGRKGPVIRVKSSGSVKLLAGTSITRSLKIEMKRVVPNLKPTAMARVTFEWMGVSGVSTYVRVAPDLSDVAVDRFDLKKTKVTIMTNYGNMTVKFHPDKAPGTVKNFVKLAKNGFYDTSGFHRIMKGFMIQGGCPNSKPGADGKPGNGWPGYRIKAEFNDIRHVKGVLSMAREEGKPDSAGCQFFIVHATTQDLDGEYTAFGELSSGLDVLDRIATVPVRGTAPVKPVKIKRMIVEPAFKPKNQQPAKK